VSGYRCTPDEPLRSVAGVLCVVFLLALATMVMGLV
jgi:hypothetical protein